VDLRVGTSGYAYKEWRGGFYPIGLSQAAFLQHYAQRLPTVELNNTFYRMPSADAVQAWCQQVPEQFRFAVKASRRITHLSRLANVAQPVDFLVQRLQGFGARLGCVLFQLPPTFRCNCERLEAFLNQLDGRLPSAFEFRHPSWLDDDVFDLLRRHNAGLCIGDPEDEANTPPSIATSNVAYVRLRKEAYSSEEISRWLSRLEALEVDSAYVFFKHETLAPDLALAMIDRASSRGILQIPGISAT
jgi:uncharacterized protein YecE (DUF72 family)